MYYQKKKPACETEKTSAESRCQFTTLSHEMLICRARALAAALHKEKKKKSYWYEAYVRARKEKKCKMPKKFSQNFNIRSHGKVNKRSHKAWKTERKVCSCIT